MNGNFGELGFNIGWMEVVLICIALLLTVGAFFLLIWALATIIPHPRLKALEKILWMILCVALPLIGSLVWLTVGRKNAATKPVQPDAPYPPAGEV